MVDEFNEHNLKNCKTKSNFLLKYNKKNITTCSTGKNCGNCT